MKAASESYAETFLTYFEVAIAQSKVQRDNVVRIRYRAYCEEFGYEAKDKFMDGM